MTSRSGSLRRARPLLGTIVEIAVHGDPTVLALALEAAFDAVAAVHRLMSFHDGASDVSRLNRAAARVPVRVDPRTWKVLAAAGRVSAASLGLFDVTVAPLLQRWGHLPSCDRAPAPSPEGDWRDIELASDGTVRFRRPVTIDLGGIAKGFAVDEAIAAARDRGAESAFVNAGGDMRVCGALAQRVHLRHPTRAGHWIDAGVLREAALASSSGAGVLPAPHVNPRCHGPAAAFDGVTVRAPTCMVADALTKVMLAAPDLAPEVLGAFDAEALAVSEGCVVACRPGVARAA
jgi:thiamine biosynthesis lipoprotein